MEPLILDPAINKKVQCQQRINEMRERERENDGQNDGQNDRDRYMFSR